MLLQRLADEKGSVGADNQGLESLYSQVTSLKLSMAATFKHRGNLSALALRLQHHEAPGPADAAQWKLGQELHGQFFRADSLEKLVDTMLCKPAAGEKEEVTDWLGMDPSDGGTLRRVGLDGTQDLVLECAVPCAVNDNASFICGRYGISNMVGAADDTRLDRLWKRQGMRIFLRGFQSVLMMPVLAAGMVVNKSVLDVLHALWSNPDVLTVHGLKNVVRVEAQQGVLHGMDCKMILQLTFYFSDGRKEIKVPDCPESALFAVSSREKVVIPPRGQNGTVIAVSGQGSALKFHWKAAPTIQ